MEKNDQKNKNFYSMVEFEKKYFPNSYKKKIEDKKKKEPSIFASALAAEHLDSIRKELAK
jgi:hypothetical protein